jgi:N-acetylmuramoyl-L-alanine amidase
VHKAALLAVGAGLGLSSWALAHSLLRPQPPAWPDERVALHADSPSFAPSFGVRRVYLDAGHGAPGNTGNRSAFCVDEQEFSASLARDVAVELEASGHFLVRLSRPSNELVPYAERVREAQAFGADVLVSLHSDVRGHASAWQPEPGVTCQHSHDAPGFTLLWSDFGESSLVERRARVARAIAKGMSAAGFLAYAGSEYHAQYAPDATPGVFVDRHKENERIFVLWRPTLPSVIVETHDALDEREAARWERPETRVAFARALMAGLTRL